MGTCDSKIPIRTIVKVGLLEDRVTFKGPKVWVTNSSACFHCEPGRGRGSETCRHNRNDQDPKTSLSSVS